MVLWHVLLTEPFLQASPPPSLICQQHFPSVGASPSRTAAGPAKTAQEVHKELSESQMFTRPPNTLDINLKTCVGGKDPQPTGPKEPVANVPVPDSPQQPHAVCFCPYPDLSELFWQYERKQLNIKLCYKLVKCKCKCYKWQRTSCRRYSFVGNAQAEKTALQQDNHKNTQILMWSSHTASHLCTSHFNVFACWHLLIGSKCKASGDFREFWRFFRCLVIKQKVLDWWSSLSEDLSMNVTYLDGKPLKE